MALQPGDTLLNGQYRILRQLGRGGFGFVYLAQESPLEEQVAIKELIPGLVGDEGSLKRFLTEAKATRRLTHERIVRTHHIFGAGGNYYIVMEYMPGGSLEERLRLQGQLPLPDAVKLGAEVCAGLAYAHQRGVVHCDLKPANILFAADGSAKVADFGIAYVSEQMLTRTWHTPAGFVAGTLPYMSPEQTDGVRDDARVDIYALGAVLYRAMTGHTYLEFDQRETPRAQADNVRLIYDQEPPGPSTYDPRIPAWLDAVILKALAKEPEARFATVGELHRALFQQPAPTPAQPALPAKAVSLPETKLAPPWPQPVSAPEPQPRRPMRPSWFWPLTGAAAVLFVLIITAIVLLLGDSTTNAPSPTVTLAAVAPTSPGLTTDTSAPPTTTPLSAIPPGGDRAYLIGTSADSPNFVFLDDRGEIVGFEPELLAAIAKAGGFEFELVDAAWEELLLDLSKGRYDAVSTGLTITPERAEMVDFSDPYLNMGEVIVIRTEDVGYIQTLDDLADLSVGTFSGSYAEQTMRGASDIRAVGYLEILNLYEQLASGELDAVVDGGLNAVAVVNEHPKLDLAVVVPPVQNELLGIAVNKDQAALLQDINRGLGVIMADGTYEDLLFKWFGAVDPFHPR